MEDIVAILARQAGKKFAEAQKNAAAEAAKRQAAIDAAKREAATTWGTPAGKPGGGPASAGRTAAPARAAAPAARTAAAAPPRAPVVAPPQPPAPPAVEALPMDRLVLPGLAVEPAHSSVALLRAFGGGESLLAGIVLAEALAPPVSLRGPQLFDRLER